MSNDWINWRFGTYHLHIGPWYAYIKQNAYHIVNKPETWFERY